MKQIFFIICLLLSVSCFCATKDAQKQAAENLRITNAIQKQAESDLEIISALERLHSIALECVQMDDKEACMTFGQEIDNIINSFNDPLEVARLMILCHNIAYTPQFSYNRYNNIFSGISEHFGYKRLKELTDHPNYLNSLSLIVNFIRLDTVSARMFSEHVSQTRHVKGVAERFSKYIK